MLWLTVIKLEGVKAAVYPLVGRAAEQHLSPSREVHQSLSQADYVPSVLYLPGHMMHLHTADTRWGWQVGGSRGYGEAEMVLP